MTETKSENKPFTMIDLDRPRKFRLTLNALVELEERVGLEITDPGTLLAKMKSFNVIRLVLYLGLLDDDPKLTEEKVGSLIEWDSLSDILDKILPYLGISKKPKNVERVTPRKRKNPGTGKLPSKRHS